MSIRSKRSQAVVGPPARVNSVLLSDSFSRADSATTMGNAETGQTWAPTSGANWGIASGKAYFASGTAAHVYASPGTGDIDFSCDITTNLDCGIIFRAPGNFTQAFYMARFNTNSLQLYKNAAGTFTLLTTANGLSIAAGQTHTLRVVAKGSSISCYSDGVLVINAFTDTAYNNSNTYIGLYIGVTTGSPRWDNVYCVAA